MNRLLRPVVMLSLARRVAVLALIGYAGVTTVLLMRLKPTTLLIGVDQYGTRIIGAGDDRLLRREKENFLKLFVSHLYNYDQLSFSDHISLSGDLMTVSLWADKKDEFTKVAQKLVGESLVQTGSILEIRQIDDDTFQLDLNIHIERKLSPSDVKLRVEIKIKSRPRSAENPYPYEVEHYDEQQIS